MDKLELTAILQNPATAMRRLLSAWANVPLLSMLEIDWERGPLVFIGLSDQMMWPLIPPGSLLRLDSRVRTIAEGAWPEFQRPIYLIEYHSRFYCCYAQRRGEMLRLISHNESLASPAVSIPFREARVRGQLTLVFRPLPTRGSAAGRPGVRRRY